MLLVPFINRSEVYFKQNSKVQPLKTLMAFQYTDWFIGILILAYEIIPLQPDSKVYSPILHSRKRSHN